MKEPIKNALPIVAAAYGEKFGIHVLFQGKQAKTDGKTIILPVAELNSPEDKAVMWGYLAHEAAHIRYTDFNVVANINHPIKHALLNIVEDIRIELCLAKAYPGTLNTINAVITYLIANKEIRYPKQDTPVNLLQMMCLLTLRLHCLKQKALTEIQQQVKTSMDKIFPLSFNQFLSKHFEEVPHLTSTQDALNWVNILLLNVMNLPDLMAYDDRSEDHKTNKTPTDPQLQSKEQSVPSSESHSKQNHSKQNSNLGKNQQSETNIIGDRTSVENNRKSSEATCDLNNSVQNSTQMYSDSGKDNKSQSTTRIALEKIASSIINADQKDIQEDLFSRAANKLNKMAKNSEKRTIIDIGRVEIAKAHNGLTELSQLKLAQKESSLLRIRLRNWLVALQQTKPAPKQKGQHLIPRRIGLSQAGETRIFEQHINKIAPNADIHLLVDRSSSMNRTTTVNQTISRYCDIANQAALSLALALEGIVGISLAVTYFGKAGNHPALTTVLRPNELVTPNASKFYQHANGNTPMAEGIWFAVHDLLKLKGKRKIIIIITDGKPSSTEQTMEVIKTCIDNNFELIGIGIREDYVKTLFNRSIVIDDPSRLKDSLFSLLQSTLQKY
ncbi:VWA domain-containing protein [Thorsellia anophelis]|uniref:von Willebrand factor type A domain-containing protein n=1 Tax=Thorsellia anophelis DSM 18579 TaxID=1123402 RepID=A0A1I0CXK4_9GAMM|nr:VWA domain-containing protein [Thorsellia anophelis]SET23871.1 von Willebrand factor type A domain-containing protein [Thorsellia anophelis DSM 18579]